MSSLLFPNEEALRVALTSGLVPPAVQSVAAGVVRLEGGALRVIPSVPVPDGARRSLRAAGVVEETADHPAADEVSCWAQAVTPRWLGEPDQIPLVLFALPHSESALDLAGELLRLGCDRQEYRFTPDGACVRVMQPPYYSVARILDRSTGTRAFVPAIAGQDRVWVELGYVHPLGHMVKASPKELVLIRGSGEWIRVADERWTDIYQLIDLAVPAAETTLPSTPPSARLSVTLRLARSTRQVAPSFWVLRTDAAREIDALVQNLPDNILDRLLFAASGDLVILRARPGNDAPPALVVPAESYVPFAGFRNLFLPDDRLVEPPLRRDRLRDLLAPDPDRVFWLAAVEGSGFRVESIAHTAFAPLSEWVDYVVHSHAPALESWVKSATFSFEGFESIGGEWGATTEPKAEKEPPVEAHRHKQKAAPEPAPAPRVPARPRAAAVAAPLEPLPTVQFLTSAEEQRLARVERRFLESTAPADDASRQALWLEMAQIQTRLKHGRESGLSWTRAVWEVDSADALPVVQQWLQAEASLIGVTPSAVLTHSLARTTPSREETRTVAAFVTWASLNPAAPPYDAHAVQVWLDAHDENLDVRSLWLARAALAKQVGGDRLGLIRTHDRILGRLQRGLSLERDVPAFLRFSSRASSDLAGAGQLIEGLEALLKKFESTKRKRSAVEAPEPLSKAYVHFVFAYGLARLGQADRAKAIRATATAALDGKDPVHGWLIQAFSARIDQALEGLPLETPLPLAVANGLNQVDPKIRYVIEQIRSCSTILEAHEALEIADGWIRMNKGAADPRGAEFAGLRGLTDTERLGREIEKLTELATQAKDSDRRRLFEGVIDFLPSLPESRAVVQLQALTRALAQFEPAVRVIVIEKLLLTAGYFGRSDLAQPLATELAELVPGLSPDAATSFATLMSRCLRSLRRLGMRDTGRLLIRQLETRIQGTGAVATASRLQLAGGLASLGMMDQALPLFETTFFARPIDVQKIWEWLPVARAFCSAAGQTNPTFALGRILPVADRLVEVTDNRSTYKYMCLSVMNFMESLVLGLASEDLELGEAGRRWLDDDEYLVRRRVHRELREH